MGTALLLPSVPVALAWLVLSRPHWAGAPSPSGHARAGHAVPTTPPLFEGAGTALPTETTTVPQLLLLCKARASRKKISQSKKQLDPGSLCKMGSSLPGKGKMHQLNFKQKELRIENTREPGEQQTTLFSAVPE